MKKKKLNGKQIKLIINILCLAVFAFSYFYLYTGYVNKTEAANKEIDFINKYMDEREKKISEEVSTAQKLEDVKVQIQTLIDKYPSIIAKEDNFMFVEQLDKALNITFSSIDPSDSTPFFTTILPMRNADGTEIIPEVSDATTTTASTEVPVVTPVPNSTTTSNLEDSVISNDTATAGNNTAGTAVNGTATPAATTMVCMQSIISMGFSSSYVSFKDLAEYIKNYPENVIIDSVSVSVDGSTGELAGTIVLKRYSLSGTGKVDESPIIDDNISIGKDNIFGTDSKNKDQTNQLEQQTVVPAE